MMVGAPGTVGPRRFGRMSRGSIGGISHTRAPACLVSSAYA
jgi:hypothetical protein